TSMFDKPMSASKMSVRRPSACSDRAKFSVKLLLPTPPLPLVTVMTFVLREPDGFCPPSSLRSDSAWSGIAHPSHDQVDDALFVQFGDVVRHVLAVGHVGAAEPVLVGQIDDGAVGVRFI